jgi:hypothetical protein
MALTTKDKIALLVAILLGTAFGYFSILAGYGGTVIGGFYGILIVPLVVVYVADQRKILIWQACIIPFALCVVVENARLGALAIAGAFAVFYIFWAVGTVISSPVPLFLYWKRTKGRHSHQVRWFFLGLVLVGLTYSLWRDPFLFLGLGFLWIVMCLVRFGWEWRTAVESEGARTATLVVFLFFVLAISTSALTAVSFKQEALFSAMNHHYLRIARLFVTIGADPNGRNAFGQTALVSAAWNGDLNGAQALISMGANVNQIQEGALSGMLPSGTALHVAAYSGRIDICKFLLEAGADVNVKNQKGATPLLVGLSRGTIACVPTLLAHGADVNSRDLQGRTALMFLATFGENDAVAQSVLHQVLANAANVDARDSNGKTAEEWATDYKREHLAEQLRLLREARSKDH